MSTVESPKPEAPTAPVGAGEFRISYSSGFAEFLERLQATLLITTYQAGKLVVVRAAKGKIHTLFRSFEQPMGIAADSRRMAIGTRNQIWTFRNAPDIAPQLPSEIPHDACYLPRSSHVTGDIRGHELGWQGDELWVVNTRFSCLCTLHPDYSFVPRWSPPFITALAAEDRCHLNGMVLDEKGPKYVTALGESDKADGWRENKAAGGLLMEVPSGRILTRGLSMPHSPRLHDGRLWVLESGRGHLLGIDQQTGASTIIGKVPGYARGLAFAGRYAFIGLSKIRESSVFGGLPIAEQQKELKCGVCVVDTEQQKVVAFLEFEKSVEEIFDVRLLPQFRFPAVVGFQKQTIQSTFIIPPQAKPLRAEEPTA